MEYDADNDYDRWLKAVEVCYRKNWNTQCGWIFRAPSGTLHDLSVADLSQLDRIEREGLFLVEVQ